MRLFLGATLLLAACGVEVRVKPHAVSRQVDAGTTASSVCGEQPFGGTELDFGALIEEAGVDPSQGCLTSASFELVTEITSIGGGPAPSGVCTAEQGVVTLDRLELVARCADGTTRTLAGSCPTPRIDLARDSPFERINACQQAFVAEQSEPLRQLINTCRPRTLAAAFVGSCSPDTCFTASFKVTFKLLDAVAVIGGSCP